MAELSNNVFHRPTASSRPTNGDDAVAAAGVETPLAAAIQAAASDTAELDADAAAVRVTGVDDVVEPADMPQGDVSDGTPAENDDADVPADATSDVSEAAGDEAEADATDAAEEDAGAPEGAGETADGAVTDAEDSAPEVATTGDSAPDATEGAAEEPEVTDAAEPADAGHDEAVQDGTVQDDAVEDTAGEEAPVDSTEPDEPLIDGADAADVGQDQGGQDEPAADAEPGSADARPAAHLRGNTTVSDGVVAKLVNAVAAGVEGVHALDGAGVEVVDDVATITVSFVAEYRNPIKAVATQIRTEVVEAAESLLELDVEAVHVNVSDLHTPDPS